MKNPLDVTNLLPVAGIRCGTACANFKKPDRRDLVVFELSDKTTTAAVFTKNLFCAAPVQVAKRHFQLAETRYLLVNTGNANAGTGDQGVRDSEYCCELVAKQTGCNIQQVLPFSTGVIGEPLQVEKFEQGIPNAITEFSEQGWQDAANGIMTTDTVPKGVSKQISLDGQTVTVTGIAKGSGMIRPDMATMLAYVATDAALPKTLLQTCLESAVNHSFNRITVDGDTSTNDACILMATGGSGVSIDSEHSENYQPLSQTIREVCEELARAMIRDGEGATKLINIDVEGGKDSAECLQVAYTIAHSPLVKTAFFASDPNWGRILAAVGRAGVSDLDLNALTIYLGDVCIVSNGGRDKAYTEQKGQAVMDKDEISVRVDLKRGSVKESVWTCDFSYDYVKINAEYRT
ncbi:MAG: bifunctional glutamate N-acetyltransferase/amino-acid acetyltransferase ArgJ [Gammaproteobacteria bacterium]|nr:bifunctional glutamate N-acetyltransferase/amino-acid acetyltransferase ArgJ [Gammaproteobacteria bacterium]